MFGGYNDNNINNGDDKHDENVESNTEGMVGLQDQVRDTAGGVGNMNQENNNGKANRTVKLSTKCKKALSSNTSDSTNVTSGNIV